MSSTKITIFNNSSSSVKVYLTLGDTPGCINDVSSIPFVTHVLNPLQGWFELGSKSSQSYTPPAGVGINGNFAFNTPPLNCANNGFPSGVNLAEFILNNSFQGSGAQETLDISGVAGTNALIQFSMTGGGAWNAGTANPGITSFYNKAIGQNVGLIGVYPYACDVCTASQNPPQCSTPPKGAPQPPVPQKTSICNVQRDASTAGGTVTVTFNGFS